MAKNLQGQKWHLKTKVFFIFVPLAKTTVTEIMFVFELLKPMCGSDLSIKLRQNSVNRSVEIFCEQCTNVNF